MTRERVWIGLSMIAAAAWCEAGVAADDRAALIDAACRKHFEAGDIHGAVLVADREQLIYKQGFGMANYEWGVPNAPNTKFRLASITKQFTSAMIFKLVEAGKIALADPVTKYLPDYRRDTGDRITIYHLLTHTAGVPNLRSQKDWRKRQSAFELRTFTVDGFVREFCSSDLEFEPGAGWRYSNTGYFLLGAVIEKVTGKTYEQAIRDTIFEPLEMSDSGFDRYETVIERRAAGYERSKEGRLSNAEYMDMQGPYSAGSLYSTAEDLYKWDRALYTNVLLADASKEIMFKPHKADHFYACGWEVHPLTLSGPAGVRPGSIVISHGGGINGFNTLITRDPQEHRLVVVLNNVAGSTSDVLTQEILEILYQG